MQLKYYARYLRMNLSKRSTTRGKRKISQYGLSSFKVGDTKLERFLPKTSESFSFFFIEEYTLRSTFFDNINF